MTLWKSQIQILSEALAKAEARAESAESALAEERRENRRTERHWASMFLRREKSLPLPLTANEKIEAQAKVEEQRKQPIPLTDIQQAMRDANRREAARFGVSEEDADRDFERKILKQMMD